MDQCAILQIVNIKLKRKKEKRGGGSAYALETSKLLKMYTLSKTYQNVNAMSIKMPVTFVMELEANLTKTESIYKWSQIAKAILSKTKAEHITITALNGIVVKTGWQWH